MYVGAYLATIRGLMDQGRYQNLFLFKKRSVAEHSWSVAKICQVLAYLEIHKYGNKVDMGTLLELAITHDELELITGDILSHTKRRTPAMQKAVNEMEKVVFEEEYSKIIPSNWEENFRRFTLEAKDDSMEGRLLSAADAIDALLEAIEEVELGNTKKFMNVLRLQAEKLLSIELDSVKHFLKHSLADFGLDVQTYYGENVFEYIQSLKESDPE
ncbi:HD domain-containing protein (plasmid) [Paenibacillus thiaminolyticus]|uniref:YfbR-like 5'-deoxynucleotidase n=1 Tax=Paenibacillus thiaminolyticus TaxID=49283 RepID=UPI00232CE6B8|nr:YfbR-like 5'-deoxynucleotidase [Paenibacillus thiaminolyticus]WCF11422.1 HD domain-containing protein [Paenibacillus thiaminolyticus]